MGFYFLKLYDLRMARMHLPAFAKISMSIRKPYILDSEVQLHLLATQYIKVLLLIG
jgi:hypothetical protein